LCVKTYNENKSDNDLHRVGMPVFNNSCAACSCESHVFSYPIDYTTKTATTTLIPLPEITLIFPVSTPTPTATITPTLASPVETPQSLEQDGLKNLSPRFTLLAVLMAILWLILMGFVILYIRQFK
jgi:hypothetical protein